MTYQSGSTCFIKHPKLSWVVGVIANGSPNNWSVKTNDSERQCVGETLDRVADKDLTTCREDLLHEQPKDLLELTNLHESTLLRCLYLRYFQDIVYTNIGAIVVALNPFNFKIPHYMDDRMQEYLKEGAVIEKNLPHSWAQAHNTYNEMISDNAPQCILISGESGAGKTEATKIVMKYLAAISCSRGSAAEKAQGLAVGEKLNACSPILETFGNAKTLRNDNSSRFGKFMKVKFSGTGQLVGAETTKYLLEKSRIVTAADNERLYHSFYLVVRGDLAGKLGLQGETNYNSIARPGQSMDNSEFNTTEEFAMVVKSMKTIGISDDEIFSSWSVVAGILALLNVRFTAEGEGSKVNPSTQQYLQSAVNLWKINMDDIVRELAKTELRVPGSAPVWKELPPPRADDVRDALAKALYDGQFSWLVNKSNQLCDVKTATTNWIGLLDIFGFEDFPKNSFEQLCINLANETLQNHYNRYIFDKDMEECRAEGIDVTAVVCPDNTPCLRLITEKGGVLSLLDEECTLGKGTDYGFLEKVASAHEKNKFFEKKKTSKEQFTIHHYAASVLYDVNGWREKNADPLKDNIRTMVRNSKDPLIANLLEAPMTAEQQQQQRSKKASTVGAFFKEQVAELMKVIESTNPHWIRCIKPHPAKKPRHFDGVQTMKQLESSGVLGTVVIRKAGFPIRTVFDKFVIRYRIIAGSKIQGKNAKDACVTILDTCSMNEKSIAQIGRSKVFMKSEGLPRIEHKRNECLQSHVQMLQKVGRGYVMRLKTNKNYGIFIQKRLIAALTDEYRQYMKRSAEVREIRARWRKEAEEKYRHLRQDVEVQSATARAHLFDEMSQQAKQMYTMLQKLLQLERERLERSRTAREALTRAESGARVKIGEDAARFIDELIKMYWYEVAVVGEMELMSLGETESESRSYVAEEERSARNRLWRSFMSMRSEQAIVALAANAISSRVFIAQAEVLNREELSERMVIGRSAVVAAKIIRKQEKEDQTKTYTRYKERLHKEKAVYKQLHVLDDMWKNEVIRARESSMQRDQHTLLAVGSQGRPVPQTTTSGGGSGPLSMSHMQSLTGKVSSALWSQIDAKMSSETDTSVYKDASFNNHERTLTSNVAASSGQVSSPNATNNAGWQTSVPSPASPGFSSVVSMRAAQSPITKNTRLAHGGASSSTFSPELAAATPSHLRSALSPPFLNPQLTPQGQSTGFTKENAASSPAPLITSHPSEFSPVRTVPPGHRDPVALASPSMAVSQQSASPGVRRKVWSTPNS